MDGHVEADLVVALAGAAVGDRVAAFAIGDLHEQLRDERPGEGGGQWIHALVEGVGLEAGPHELADEPVTTIDDVGTTGPRGQRAVTHALAQ